MNRFGFVPNDGRIYYSQRSQPPLLPGMIKSYVDATKDTDFIKESVILLEKEFDFWLTNRTVQVNGHKMLHYGDNSSGPRPESYYENIQTAASIKTGKENFYSELKAGAESGMDFTSRFYMNPDDMIIGQIRAT